MENKIFNFALIASLIIHIVALTRLSYSNAHHLTQPLKNIEIAYYALTADGTRADIDKSQEPDIDKELKNKTEVFLRKQPDSSPFMKDISKLVEQFKQHTKQPAAVAAAQKKHVVSVPALKSEEIEIPEYQLYYHDIRNLIRKRALANIDFSRFDTGDVYLTFIVSSDGILTKIQILNDRTQASEYLRDISLSSVHEAAESFSAFPTDLQYPELPFNVVISFKLEEEG